MELLDATILSPAAPAIAASLEVSVPAVAVSITAYLITVAVLIPASGTVAERLGTRNTLVAAIVIFTVASGCCALASSLAWLVAARVLQGAGGAMMVPVGRLAVLRVADKRDLLRVMARLTWPALLAPVLAPLLGGLFATYLTWRYVFLINVPIGLAAAVAALMLAPHRLPSAPRRFDWVGFGLTAASSASIVIVGSIIDSTSDWLPIAIGSTVSVTLVTSALHHLNRTVDPLLDLTLLRIPTFRLTELNGGLFRVGVSGVPFALPLMFQLAFGWSAVSAGGAVMAVFAGNLGIKPFTTSIVRRLRFRNTLCVSTLTVVGTLIVAVTFSASTSITAILIVLVISGAARSVAFTAYVTLTFVDVAEENMSRANTLNETVQQLAGGFGISVAALSVHVGTVLTGSSNIWPYRLALGLLALIVLCTMFQASRLGATVGHQLLSKREPR